MSVSRCSWTRCRTWPWTTSRPCAGPPTRSASSPHRCCWWAPDCRTCRRRWRRRSRTPSGCSATSTVGPSAAGDGRAGLAAPRGRGGRGLRAGGAGPALPAHRGLPLLRPGVRQGHLGRRPPIADPGADVREAAAEAEAELAVGFFGARYDRATPAERDYLIAMADLGADAGDAAVATADVARRLGRKPQSLSPARDGLIKKGLVYSAERGRIGFTVPHFGHFLRSPLSAPAGSTVVRRARPAGPAPRPPARRRPWCSTGRPSRRRARVVLQDRAGTLAAALLPPAAGR